MTVIILQTLITGQTAFLLKNHQSRLLMRTAQIRRTLVAPKSHQLWRFLSQFIVLELILSWFISRGGYYCNPTKSSQLLWVSSWRSTKEVFVKVSHSAQWHAAPWNADIATRAWCQYETQPMTERQLTSILNKMLTELRLWRIFQGGWSFPRPDQNLPNLKWAVPQALFWKSEFGQMCHWHGGVIPGWRTTMFVSALTSLWVRTRTSCWTCELKQRRENSRRHPDSEPSSAVVPAVTSPSAHVQWTPPSGMMSRWVSDLPARQEDCFTDSSKTPWD